MAVEVVAKESPVKLHLSDGVKVVLITGTHIIYQSSGEREVLEMPSNCTDMFVTIGQPTTALAEKRQAEALDKWFQR